MKQKINMLVAPVRITLLLSLLMVMSLSPSAFACVAPPGKPWFAVNVAFDNNPLSNDLAVSSNEDMLKLTNLALKSNAYIITKDTDGIYPGYPVSLGNHRPLDDVIGHDYEPRLLINVDATGLGKGTYAFNGGWSKVEDSQDNTATISIFTLLNPTEVKSQQHIGNGRPADLPAPVPQPFTLHVYYDGQIYDIPGTITYSSSPTYSPQYISCNEDPIAKLMLNNKHASNNKHIAIAGAGLVAIAGLVTIVYIKRKANPKPKSKVQKKRKSKRSK